MDRIGASILGEQVAPAKVGHKVSSEFVLSAVRSNIMKGSSVISELQKVASMYPKDVATKVASGITPCDHLVGYLWVDSASFKNSMELRDFIKKRPTVSHILMSSLPQSSYWKSSSVKTQIPMEQFGRKVSTTKEPFLAEFKNPRFLSSLVAEGFLSKMSADKFREKMSAEAPDLVKLASELELELKKPNNTSDVEVDLGIDFTDLDDGEFSQAFESEETAETSDVEFTDVDEGIIDLDEIGKRYE